MTAQAQGKRKGLGDAINVQTLLGEDTPKRLPASYPAQCMRKSLTRVWPIFDLFR